MPLGKLSLLKWKNIAGDYASEQPGGQTIIESFGSHPKCRSKQIHKRDSDYKKGDEVELSGNSRFSNSAEDSPTDSNDASPNCQQPTITIKSLAIPIKSMSVVKNEGIIWRKVKMNSIFEQARSKPRAPARYEANLA